MNNQLLTPEQTRPWLQYQAAKALKELEFERRRQAFRETKERVRRMWER